MPRFRATISGPGLDQVDGATSASGVPTDRPLTESVDASIDGEDAADAERKLREALPDAYTVRLLEG